jgi:hypothetical protein
MHDTHFCYVFMFFFRLLFLQDKLIDIADGALMYRAAFDVNKGVFNKKEVVYFFEDRCVQQQFTWNVAVYFSHIHCAEAVRASHFTELRLFMYYISSCSCITLH